MQSNFKQLISIFLKGIGMGTANVIPGVSGGTIALITGVFEKLIHSIKAFNITAIKLLFKGKFKEFANYINLDFLIAIGLGIAISIISLAKLLDFLFINYPIFIWAFFFGLILASIFFVGKTISKWSISVILIFILGTSSAIALTFLNPATENDSFLYLVFCGVIAACSMILPGLSGSFILILLGNYELVMIDAINQRDLSIILPVVIGAGFGLLAFSHLLSWIFKKFKDQTISLLTGFILGSLVILWPWKKSYSLAGDILPTNKFGAFIDSNNIILDDISPFSYERIIPESFDQNFFLTFAFILLGIFSIYLLERLADKKKT